MAYLNKTTLSQGDEVHGIFLSDQNNSIQETRN